MFSYFQLQCLHSHMCFIVSDLVKQAFSAHSCHSQVPREGVNFYICCSVWCPRRCRWSSAMRLPCLCTESPVQEFISLPIFFLRRGLTHYIDYRAPPTIHDQWSAICYARWIGMNTMRYENTAPEVSVTFRGQPTKSAHMMHHITHGVLWTPSACSLTLRISLQGRNHTRRCWKSSRSWMSSGVLGAL